MNFVCGGEIVQVADVLELFIGLCRLSQYVVLP